MAQTHQQVKHVHHGNSVAAWVSVTVMMVGSLVAAVAVAAKSTTLGILGTVVVVVGVVLGKVLQVAGYGIKHPEH
jgi:hypothetical protein